ncbi:hypothetical protein SPRG_02575 [Saprolegnia parasitica CBS 223.65]|uniref:Uncharacterized protein n=1 Tax=Saprolegnia parasitica (strain CBS 223.65) TaxID=695850 RepID=A0A067CQU7_SAPPC|nr:hypothetical protein SPRG_02575 [Saprolegnia parasitica CBS 223.65]KDO32883.1 hypothetical protein SPRG_02575 [Saprolegnia parasitica CBS 223.65]|eukprot:XP_012196534.1 hypothetical protein SPRG_02575 [Saprolegnia parasitica CBS 223.65]
MHIFLLLWQYLDDGNTLQDGIQMTELLHDLLTSGDGLEDHGMCGLDGDRTFLLTTRQILTKIQEKADKSDESLIEDLEEALAQCYCCLYGYALLPSCVEHMPKEGKKPTPKSADDMFALLTFAQSLDPKHCTRKECYLLYKDVLALPETAEMMKTSLFDNNAIGGYVNPVASADVHVKLPPIAAAKNAPTPDATPVNDLWFLLATTMPLPKCKRRGKDYNVLLEYEQYCLQYMQYLRRDVRVHPLRAEAYELLAQSAKTLRALVVDHMNVVWSNHFVLQALPLQRTILLEAGVQPTFDEISATPFFQNVLQWTDAVDKTLPDDVASLMPKSRLFLRQYTQYTATLTELALRSMDMAAELDPAAYRVECGEDSGFLLYARLSERQLANTEAVRVAEAAGRYFKNALADASCSPVTTLRVHYMLGKLGKKILTLHNERHLSSSWRSVLESFANADKARVDDDADEYLVHAFHLLHATRLKLLLAPVLQRCTPATVPELRHAPLPRLDDALPSAEMLALIEAFAYEKDDATPVVLETDPRKRFQAALENCVSALEVVPQEDKYFHPAYFSLARGVFYAGAIIEDETKYGAAAALKAMKPLFDKKRSQIVSVWLSESDTHKLDELHQTQAAYDKLRLKYHQFYMHLLTAGGDYARICEITNWITSSKEEHWVLDAMLAQALVARSYLARGRVLDMFMKCLFPQSDDEPASAKAVAHLHRMYGVYMESQDAWQRARPYNHGSSMGSWLWEVTMAYALAQASLIESGADLLGVVAVAHVKTHLDTRDPLTTNETSLLGLHLELKMEDRRDWADLVDNTLAYCATTWPEKTKSNKSKLPTPKTKPHLTLA